ncbi:hypothetical protein [Roseicella frigidaeris]|uniref:DUF4426 domain-containing protein n=1 Tax=Roseicella frigidaeris TaxID=2230885 RepID=A0A327M5B4_9PROT|nr:hypothetical protein [Roseicella frigidaeris]RAI55238.1 hypothetical protein DOO78_24620 [Roseicella frigidaeris]
MDAIRKTTASAVPRRRALLGAAIGLAFTSVPHDAGAVHSEGAFRRAGNLVVYLGVVPAAVVRGHPPEHTGKSMHGGAPEGRYVHHLLVAVFEEATGARVTDAAVTATIHGRRHSPETRIALEPMTLDGATVYGGFATLPPRDYYRLEVEVRRPGAAPVRAIFPHRHFQP